MQVIDMKASSLASRPCGATGRQEGAALIVALIFLIVLTVIGIGVAGTTTTEEKLARNFRDLDISFAATEAAIRDAEVRIAGTAHKPALPLDSLDFPDDPGTCNDQGLCDCMYGSCNGYAPVHERYSLTGSPSVELGTGSTGTPEIAQVPDQPRYLIEKACYVGDGSSRSAGSARCPKYYRITAQGQGRLTALTTIQSTYIP